MNSQVQHARKSHDNPFTVPLQERSDASLAGRGTSARRIPPDVELHLAEPANSQSSIRGEGYENRGSALATNTSKNTYTDLDGLRA